MARRVPGRASGRAGQVTRLAFAVTLGAVAGVLAALQPLSDTDMWWHLATGRETLGTGFVRRDIFSWTVSGSSITTDQWLGQVALWLSYAWLGWKGVAMARVALAVALITLVVLAAARAATRPLAILLATIPALLLTRAVIVDRPELMGFVLFAALLVLLRDAQTRERASGLVAIVALIFVWTNVHGSFALGVGLVVIACLEAAMREPRRRAAYAMLAVASLAVTLLNPAGLGVWTAPGSHLLSPPRDIQEWNVVDVRSALGATYVAVLALFVASALLGPRVARRELAILVPVALISLTAARQAPLLAIAAAPLFAERAQAILDRVSRAAAAARMPRALAIAVPSALILVALVMTPAETDDRAYPVAALASIPLGDRTLARYEWGGWLIWSGVPVFVDGRLTPYANGVLDDYRRIVAAAPGWEEAIARHGVRMLLVAPTDAVATRARERGWPVRFESDVAVVIAVP